MLKGILMVSAALILVTGGIALAQDGQSIKDGSTPGFRQGPPVFADIDTNHDGVISKSEFDAFKPKPPEGRGHGKPHWDRADDRRGPHDGHMGPPDFKTLDANGDGKVTFDEFTARMKAHFDRLDSNHDGVLEPSELPAPPADGGPPPPPPAG